MPEKCQPFEKLQDKLLNISNNCSLLQKKRSIAIFKLQLVEFVIIALVFEQLLVSASLDNAAVLENDYLVGVLYG